MALSFNQIRSTSPTFSEMSQESSSTAMSSNLEHQLSDAMTAIQMLMQNVGALTQQVTVMEQPLSPLSYLFDLINYASLILLNKLSILFHPIIVWPCG